MILSNIMLAHNKQKKMVKYAIIATMINVILNIFLIPIWGIIGAAFATLAAEALNLGFVWYEAKKISRFVILPYVKKVLFGTIIMGLVCFELQKFGVEVIINIIASAGTYMACLILLKEEIMYDFVEILKLVKGRPTVAEL